MRIWKCEGLPNRFGSVSDPAAQDLPTIRLGRTGLTRVFRLVRPWRVSNPKG